MRDEEHSVGHLPGLRNAGVPVAHTLRLKGVPEGIAFAFVMAASGVGLPSLLLLSKLVDRRLLLCYVGVLAALLVLLGWALNAALA